MRNRTMWLTLATAALALVAAWRAETRTKGPVVRLEGDRIELKGDARHGYLIVTTGDKGALKIYAYELGAPLICLPGDPCEQCRDDDGCVAPPPPPSPACPAGGGACLRGVYGAPTKP